MKRKATGLEWPAGSTRDRIPAVTPTCCALHLSRSPEGPEPQAPAVTGNIEILNFVQP
jgi:hypothetical protein